MSSPAEQYKFLVQLNSLITTHKPFQKMSSSPAEHAFARSRDASTKRSCFCAKKRLPTSERSAARETDMLPREGDRYAAATAFLAKLGVDSTAADALLASGLKWNSVGASVPPEGCALDAPALASALESKTCFTRAEWDEFRIEDLRMDHFVKCLGEYFKPVLLFGGVETSSDDRLPVPALVKKHWQQWNQTAHPDKGGDTEAYCVRKEEYTVFKMHFAEWLQAHPTGQPDFQTWCRSSMPASRGPLAEDASRRTKLKAEIKEQGEKAMQAGQKALKGGQYEDAKELASVAVRHFEQCQRQRKVSDKLVSDMIDRANGVIGQAEEGVRRLQEEARKQEAIEGLDRLWRSVCASVADRGLDWAQKIAVVQDHFTNEKVLKKPYLSCP
jgi:hypothetical protein